MLVYDLITSFWLCEVNHKLKRKNKSYKFTFWKCNLNEGEDDRGCRSASGVEYLEWNGAIGSGMVCERPLWWRKTDEQGPSTTRGRCRWDMGWEKRTAFWSGRAKSGWTESTHSLFLLKSVSLTFLLVVFYLCFDSVEFYFSFLICMESLSKFIFLHKYIYFYQGIIVFCNQHPHLSSHFHP